MTALHGLRPAPRFNLKQEFPMLSDPDQEMRLECLRLAVQMQLPDMAREFYAFVTGASDQTPREQIDAALDKANVR